MSGIVLAACAASTPIPGTQGLCPSDPEWAAFGVLVIVVFVGTGLFLAVCLAIDFFKSRRK